MLFSENALHQSEIGGVSNLALGEEELFLSFVLYISSPLGAPFRCKLPLTNLIKCLLSTLSPDEEYYEIFFPGEESEDREDERLLKR